MHLLKQHLDEEHWKTQGESGGVLIKGNDGTKTEQGWMEERPGVQMEGTEGDVEELEDDQKVVDGEKWESEEGE